MVHPLSYDYNATAQIAAATYPNVRLFQVGRQETPTPQWQLACNATATSPGLSPNCSTRNRWHVLSPASVPTFSAVCYLTAQEIVRKHLGLATPLGLIESDWGGTPNEAWEPMAAGAAYDPASGKCTLPNVTSTATATPRPSPRPSPAPANANGWPAANCNASFGCLYNGMIAPLTLSTSPSLVLWYQGEADQNVPGPEVRSFQTTPPPESKTPQQPPPHTHTHSTAAGCSR